MPTSIYEVFTSKNSMLSTMSPNQSYVLPFFQEKEGHETINHAAGRIVVRVRQS
ncbi:hypothetical protein NMYAN_30124 [Nitrosomonas nitrosa]|jgi:hypothetical protein|uniref:Uncharacterized protein n=1 Tax=Nitrosomonas nitrosa TaxID=52442 RepID=A0A8H8Z2H8_9PROT|nr:hypothetical protein NMYAN_30124 [Nitrosomonas nitrosa]